VRCSGQTAGPVPETAIARAYGVQLIFPRRSKVAPNSASAATNALDIPNSGTELETALGICTLLELDEFPPHCRDMAVQPPGAVVVASHVIVKVVDCPDVTRPPHVDGMKNV
jgi:hypothetical protein